MVEACDAADTWKAGLSLRYTVTIVAADDRPRAEAIVASMLDGPTKRQATRWLAEGCPGYLRPFYR